MADRIPRDVVDTLVGSWRSWSTFGAGLDEAQWNKPTELPGWCVQDLLSHLTGIERLLEGLPASSPLAGMPDHVHNQIGELNEREVAARRALSGAAVLAEWDELRVTREATLAAAGPDYFAREMMTPTGPGTMAEFLATRIVDCWCHEQDARRALGLPGNVDGPAAEHTIGRLARAIPMVVGKRAGCPEAGAVAFSITGPIVRSVVCEVVNGRARVVDTPTPPPVASIAMDSDTFLILATGRRRAADVAARITIEGDADLGRRVVDNLNVMI